MKNKNEKTNKNTELVFIIDCSGSMSGLESDTIGGFNSVLKKQREGEGNVFVSTVLFSDCSQVIHDRVEINEVEELTQADYTVGGCTALIDAIGGAIHHIGNIHKYARQEDVPSKTLFVIITDGMENASRSYSSQNVKAMIERQESKYKWEFLFLGANIDAVGTAASIGISRERAVNYNCDSQGTKTNFDAINEAVTMTRCCENPLSSEWRASIDNDFKSRKSNR